MLPNRSFIFGFLAGTFFVVVWWLIASHQTSGGRSETSPSGQYELSIYAPLQPTAGGTYELVLADKATGQELRTITVTLDPRERTKSVRGPTPITTTWDPAEAYADVAIDGQDLVRVVAPVTGR